MQLTPAQRRLCDRVLNAFETGSAAGDYGNISIFHDGPGNNRQITYGRSQTTEYGHLAELVHRYVGANGTYSASLAPYEGKVGVVALVDDQNFLNLLMQAGNDPVMQMVQDDFFNDVYFVAAKRWAEANGFTLPLSMLVIYDSFVHSGSILDSIRSKFPEVPPARGGNEKTWISQYVAARQNFLANHRRAILHNTVYRTKCLRAQIQKDNWDLSQVPIDANGVKVLPAPGAQGPVEPGHLDPVHPDGFVARAARVAQEQLDYFKGHKEFEDPYYKRIGEYWQGLGMHIDGRNRDMPWSAAFISYVMRSAGAGTRFAYSSAHSHYISLSISDRRNQNQDAGYWGYRLNERKLEVGDLVCWDRDPNLDVDYDHQYGGGYKSHTDLVVAVRSGEIDIVGGNVSDSVTKRTLSLNDAGYLDATKMGGEKLFAIMGCRIS
jgi:hypothetical protein